MSCHSPSKFVYSIRIPISCPALRFWIEMTLATFSRTWIKMETFFFSLSLPPLSTFSHYWVKTNSCTSSGRWGKQYKFFFFQNLSKGFISLFSFVFLLASVKEKWNFIPFFLTLWSFNTLEKTGAKFNPSVCDNFQNLFFWKISSIFLSFW
jgi:hypothetical protein